MTQREHLVSAGFTLVELLVAMSLSLVLAGVLVQSFVTNVETYSRMTEFAEAKQGVRAVLSELSQEVRQAGACLPSAGEFVAMSGEDAGTSDTLTIRMGRVFDDLTCIQPVLAEDADAGDSVIVVNDATGIRNHDWLYIKPSAALGDFYRVGGVSGEQISLEGNIDDDLPQGTVIYSIEERTYAIAESDGAKNLTVSIDGEEPVVLVPNVDSLDVTYGLDPCPPCTKVEAPADEDEWRLVRAITVEVGVKPPNGGQTSAIATGQTTISPRNLM